MAMAQHLAWPFFPKTTRLSSSYAAKQHPRPRPTRVAPHGGAALTVVNRSGAALTVVNRNLGKIQELTEELRQRRLDYDCLMRLYLQQKLALENVQREADLKLIGAHDYVRKIIPLAEDDAAAGVFPPPSTADDGAKLQVLSIHAEALSKENDSLRAEVGRLKAEAIRQERTVLSQAQARASSAESARAVLEARVAALEMGAAEAALAAPSAKAAKADAKADAKDGNPS